MASPDALRTEAAGCWIAAGMNADAAARQLRRKKKMVRIPREVEAQREVGPRARVVLSAVAEKKEERWAGSQFEPQFWDAISATVFGVHLNAIFACATHGSAACATRGRASGAPAAGTTTNSMPRARCDGWQTLRAISRSRTLLEPISHLRAIGGGIWNSRVCTTLPC